MNKYVVYTKELGKISTNNVEDFIFLTLHRTDGPAFIEYNTDYGTKSFEEWWVDRKKHRTDGPAVVSYDTNNQPLLQVYYKDDKVHRIGGPARIYHDNGRITTEEWLVDDNLHRLDGPAIINYKDDGSKEISFYIHNRLMSYTEFENAILQKKMNIL